MNFTVVAGQSKRKRKYRPLSGSCQKAEKAAGHEGDSYTKCSWCT